MHLVDCFYVILWFQISFNRVNAGVSRHFDGSKPVNRPGLQFCGISVFIVCKGPPGAVSIPLLSFHRHSL